MVKQTAYIGLGSNLNQPKVQIKQAIMALEAHNNIKMVGLSKLYQSTPLLNMPQPNYYNATVKINTSLSPIKLLEVCQQIEQDQHRVKEKKWGARTIDLDILLFDEQVLDTQKLTIPHYDMHNRGFVLLPLLDIDAELSIPILGKIKTLITKIDLSGVTHA